MAALANQLLLLAAPEIVPLPEHPAVYAPRIPSARVVISPASTNQNLTFHGNFERLFRGTSLLGGEFLRHPAFEAVFKARRLHDDDWHGSDEEGKFPGWIVALSYDSAAAGRLERKGLRAPKLGVKRRDFALKSARKGLVSTIMTAYNQHCNLLISPDEVWLTILAQFSTYVNRNAEELRSRIVAHEGQIELVAYDGSGALENANYPRMIGNMLGEIRKNIKSPELADWFRPGFSTTTERDEVRAAATAMGSLQAYFTYKMVLSCGLSLPTLMGTAADWKLLREKIDRLLEFEVENNPEGNVMEVWVSYLRKVSDGFIESAENPRSAKTLEFWDKVLSHKGRGSGPPYISGWVTAFTCFDKDGNFIGKRKGMWGMNTEFPVIESVGDISHNVISCPVKIDDNGMEYDGTLFTGQVVFEAERGEKDAYPTIRPRNDWSMAVAVK